MTFFDRIKHGYDSTKFKADQLLRINRIQKEIGELRRDITVLQTKISNTAMLLFNKGELTNQELVELCSAIKKINAGISKKETKIISIKDEEAPQFSPPTPQLTPLINPCPNCRFEVQIGAEFCTHCGNPMPLLPETTSTETEIPTIACTNCGTTISSNAEFCSECGQRVIPNDNLM